MIARLHGTVSARALDSLILMVGGLGLRVLVTPATADQAQVGEELDVHTSLVVREDALTLYGFASADERDIFERLQSVSGIGPRIAVAALSVLTPDDIRRAVRDGDIATLQRIPGVGKKSAQRMALDLVGKLGAPAAVDGMATPQPRSAAEAATIDTVTAALVQLGWTQAAAGEAVASLADSGLGASDMLKAALLKLGGNRG